MKIPHLPQIVASIALLGVGGSMVANFPYTVITDQHADLLIGYQDGVWSAANRADLGTFDTAQSLLFDGPQGTTILSRPDGVQWDFLGVGAGESLYVWPQFQNVDQIFLGIRADAGSVATGSFGSYFETDTRVAATAPWIKVQLTGMTFTPPESTSETGAAAFSLWQTDATGTTVWMSTADGIGVSDATWLAAGGHAHYNWGFSRAGHYALRFQFSGYTGSGQLSLSQSPEFTFHFGVEHTPLTIPEPSTSAQFAGALCAGLAILRSPSRRKKQRSPAP